MILDYFRLDGQVALVTGGSGGLGGRMATALAEAGADVVIAAHTHQADEIEAQILALGRRACTYRGDLSNFDTAADLVEFALRQFSRLDILVNNAGIIRSSPAVETDLQEWQEVLNVNLTSAWALSQQAAKFMLAQGRGKIINIGSILSFQGGRRVVAYTASKHAIVGLTKALANEWAAKGINVNAIAPGEILTDKRSSEQDDVDHNREIISRIPYNRWGSPDDLAGSVVFLASRASDYINGHTLVVDGGWLLR